MRKTRNLAAGVLALTTALAAPSALAQGESAVLVTVASGLNQPIGLVPEPGSDSRLYVIGKTGVIRLLRVQQHNSTTTYTLTPTPVLDISSRVYSSGTSGMLGLALAPDYATSGHAYVHSTSNVGGLQNSVIERYTRDPANPERLNPASRALVFSAPHGSYHHGGTLRFGPDGHLYFARGDEGDLGILLARNPGTLFGKLLRIDVTPGRDDFPLDPNRNYAITLDNPYRGVPGCMPEVYGMGLRSPWLFSFDRLTSDLWMADVGESSWEEITRVAAATPGPIDFGWPSYEGLAVGPFGLLGADPSRISFPAYVYPHTLQPGFTQAQVGCSVNGGYVYRGSLIPELQGRYLWSDFCSSRVFSGRAASGHALAEVTDMTAALLAPAGQLTPAPISNPTSFGQDNAGELFITELNGRVRKIIPRSSAADIGSGGGAEGGDGRLDANDFVVFITWYFESDNRCDLGSTGGVPGADGVLDNNDFVVFIGMFFDNLP